MQSMGPDHFYFTFRRYYREEKNYTITPISGLVAYLWEEISRHVSKIPTINLPVTILVATCGKGLIFKRKL